MARPKLKHPKKHTRQVCFTDQQMARIEAIKPTMQTMSDFISEAVMDYINRKVRRGK